MNIGIPLIACCTAHDLSWTRFIVNRKRKRIGAVMGIEMAPKTQVDDCRTM